MSSTIFLEEISSNIKQLRRIFQIKIELINSLWRVLYANLTTSLLPHGCTLNLLCICMFQPQPHDGCEFTLVFVFVFVFVFLHQNMFLPRPHDGCKFTRFKLPTDPLQVNGLGKIPSLTINNVKKTCEACFFVQFFTFSTFVRKRRDCFTTYPFWRIFLRNNQR